jgi:hypothetical protein
MLHFDFPSFQFLHVSTRSDETGETLIGSKSNLQAYSLFQEELVLGKVHVKLQHRAYDLPQESCFSKSARLARTPRLSRSNEVPTKAA